MQLESLETAGNDAAVRPPVAATQQSPESMENAGRARPQRWLGHRPQRMVYEFARPVFRRCGRHLRAQKWFSNSEYTCFRITKIGEDEGRSYPAIVNQPMAPNGRLPLDMGLARIARWHCDAGRVYRSRRS